MAKPPPEELGAVDEVFVSVELQRPGPRSSSNQDPVCVVGVVSDADLMGVYELGLTMQCLDAVAT